MTRRAGSQGDLPLAAPGAAAPKPTAAVRRVGTAEVRDAMARRWRAPEYALIPEVADATGGRHSRSADALIMGLWPSRGVLLDGVEIKTQRSDWLRELKDPGKAEAVARYCDRWWIHAGPDVVRPEELPTGWGLRVWDGRVWTEVVEATARTPEPMTRTFLAALLRRSDQQNDRAAKAAADAMLEAERAAIDRLVEARVEQRTKRHAGMAAIAEEFEAAFGIPPEEMLRNGEFRHAAAIAGAILRRDLHNPYGGLPWLVRTLRDVAERASEVMGEIGIDPPAAGETLMRGDRAATAKRGPRRG